MKLSITWTAQFKKDYKLAMKRELDIDLLDNIRRFSAPVNQRVAGVNLRPPG